MLADVIPMLICPHCGGDFREEAGALRCGHGHAFDVARQGYVNLLPGDARPGTADTAAMVDARARFLGSGHYAHIADEVVEAARRTFSEAARGAMDGASSSVGPVVDVGAGTGYYLARVVDALGAEAGLALDVSKHACRRAARAHPRIGAAVCDAWEALPVRSGCASLVLSVFAPRNATAMRRILRPGGALVVVTPTADHLRELVSALGLLRVDERKSERLDGQLSSHFRRVEVRGCEAPMALARGEVQTVVGMGPSAWHTSAERIAYAVERLPDGVDVTLSVEVSTYAPV